MSNRETAPRLRALCVAAAWLALLSAAPAAATTIVIDDFETGDLFVRDPPAVAGGDITEVAAASVLGGTRYARADLGGLGIVSVRVISGTGRVSTDSKQTTGRGIFHYDGTLDGTTTGGTGLGGVDLTNGGVLGQFALDVQTGFGGIAPASVVVTVSGPGGSGFASVTATGAGLLTIPFSTFVPTAGTPDFTSVRSINLRVDLFSTFDEIRFESFAAIPEPGAASLLGLGLVALAAARVTSSPKQET